MKHAADYLTKNDSVEVLLYADGSPERGLGHLYRIYRLYHFFFQQNDAVFFVSNSFQRNFYLAMGIPNVKLVNEGKFSCRLAILDSKEKNLPIQLADMELFETIAIDSRSEWALRCHALVFPSFYFDKDSVPVGVDATIYAGREYCLPIEVGFKKIDYSTPFILVTMGGADPNNLTELVCESLLAESCRGLSVKVLIGRGFSRGSDYFKNKFPRFEFIDNLDQTAGIISAARIVVTALGTTTQEIEFYKKPCILIFNYDTDTDDFAIIKGQSKNPENWMFVGHFLDFDAQSFLSQIWFFLGKDMASEAGASCDAWASGWKDLIDERVGLN